MSKPIKNPNHLILKLAKNLVLTWVFNFQSPKLKKWVETPKIPSMQKFPECTDSVLNRNVLTTSGRIVLTANRLIFLCF